MNKNGYLRSIYEGKFTLAGHSVDELCYDDSDIDYGNSSSKIRFIGNGKKYEVMIEFRHSPAEDDIEMLSLIGKYISFKSRVSKDYFDDGIYGNSPVEFYHVVNSEKAEKNLERLESGLKKVFELDYISQNPAQLLRTLRSDRKFLEEVVGRRIAGRGHDEIIKYAKHKRIFNFKTGRDNLIFAHGKNIEIERRHGTEKPILEKAIMDFAEEGGYEVERPDTDVLGRTYFDFESDEIPCTINLNKKVKADDVIRLLGTMANYWEKPWEALPITGVERVIGVEPVLPPPEERTVLTSYCSDKAALVAKMMRALPKENVRNVLGKCIGRTIKEIKEGRRSVEVEYVNKGRPYRQRVDIERTRVGTEFAVNTSDERVAHNTLAALSEILLNEINRPKNHNVKKKKEVLAAVRA
jgi:hypothetical protein